VPLLLFEEGEGRKWQEERMEVSKCEREVREDGYGRERNTFRHSEDRAQGRRPVGLPEKSWSSITSRIRLQK